MKRILSVGIPVAFGQPMQAYWAVQSETTAQRHSTTCNSIILAADVQQWAWCRDSLLQGQTLAPAASCQDTECAALNNLRVATARAYPP